MSRPAVFLDRDGTIVEERGYLDRLETLTLFPWTVDALRLIKRAGFATVVITNQAGVVSLALDGDTADNNASAQTTVNAAADLSLTKSGSPDPVLVGQTLTYTLSAHNSGPQDTTGVSLTDTLPVNWSAAV